jgi:thioredoxin-dependent peroxiredoxin
MTLKTGASVPDISLKGTSGRSVTLRSLPKAILYFYPKDKTPGCTTQACGFRDNQNLIEQHGWHVYGISSDPIHSHESFISAHYLGFELLSDPDRSAAEAFGVTVSRSMFGRMFASTKRITFAIENGVIVNVWKANATSNAHDVLKWIEGSARTEPF